MDRNVINLKEKLAQFSLSLSSLSSHWEDSSTRATGASRHEERGKVEMKKPVAVLLVFGVLAVSACAPGTETPKPKDLASEHDLMMGATLDYWHFWDPIVLKTFLAEFNTMMTSAGGFAEMRPEADQWNFDYMDALVELCQDNDIGLVFHSLLLFSGYPSWLAQENPSGSLEQITTLDRSEMLAVMYEWIDTVVGRYQGKIDYYYVVNEAIITTWTAEDGFWTGMRPSIWYEAIGPDYTALAINRAHQADPNAKLFLNEGFHWGRASFLAYERFDLFYNLVNDLLNQGVPLDGVGLMYYTEIDFPLEDWQNEPDFDQFHQEVEAFLDLGLEVHISEVGVPIWSEVNSTTLQEQAENYQRTLDLALDYESVTLFNVWGINDYFGEWWEGDWEGLEADAPLLLDDYNQPKPAYYALQHRLQGNTELYQHDFSNPAINPGPDPPIDGVSGVDPPITLNYSVTAADYDSSGSWVLSDGTTTFGELSAGAELVVTVEALPTNNIQWDPDNYNRIDISGDGIEGIGDGDYAWYDYEGIIRGVPTPNGLLWTQGVYNEDTRLSWEDQGVYQQFHSYAMFEDHDLEITNSATAWGYVASNENYRLELLYDKETGILEYYHYTGNEDSELPLDLEIALSQE